MKQYHIIAILSIVTLFTFTGCPWIFGPPVPTATPVPPPTAPPELTPTPAPGGDMYEPDDTYQQANDIYEGEYQDHTLHSSTDQDFMMFYATNGTDYTIETFSPVDNLDTVLYLYGTNGITELANDDDGGVSYQSLINWTCPGNGTYYLRVVGFSGDMGSYSILLIEAGGPTAVPTTAPTAVPGGISEESTYSGSGDEVFHIDTTGAVNLTHTLHLGSSTADVYYVFTNTTPYTDITHPVISGRKAPKDTSVDSFRYEDLTEPGLRALRGRPDIDAFNRDVSDLLIKGKPVADKRVQRDTVGNSVVFMDDYYGASTVSATCRASVTDGTKTLNIYVANDCWAATGSTKTYEITQAMVDAMTNKFLLAGTNNDINDWVTTIFGQEWGSHSYNNLITDNNNITILLYDIEGNDVPTGSFIAGFFWSKDNFLTSSISGSNERIMFYIDAVMYAYPEGGTWDITDYWPREMISTLAHEFQHMIHFYQKGIATGNNGSSSETWINEMCSVTAEDFVANKILANGPRGVTYNDPTAGTSGNTQGRLPRFNYINDYSLTEWNQELHDYSTVYAFGSYMARNFGGVQLFQKIVQNTPTDYEAINQALSAQGYTGEDFSGLLRKWGAAMLLSDNTSPPTGYYQYNQGAYFNSTVSGITYNLGSINLYNYTYSGQVGPYIYTTSPVGSGQHSSFLSASNRLYLAGSGLTGDVVHSMQLADGAKLTVVVKE